MVWFTSTSLVLSFSCWFSWSLEIVIFLSWRWVIPLWKSTAWVLFCWSFCRASAAEGCLAGEYSRHCVIKWTSLSESPNSLRNVSMYLLLLSTSSWGVRRPVCASWYVEGRRSPGNSWVTVKRARWPNENISSMGSYLEGPQMLLDPCRRSYLVHPLSLSWLTGQVKCPQFENYPCLQSLPSSLSWVVHFLHSDPYG